MGWKPFISILMVDVAVFQNYNSLQSPFSVTWIFGYINYISTLQANLYSYCSVFQIFSRFGFIYCRELDATIFFHRMDVFDRTEEDPAPDLTYMFNKVSITSLILIQFTSHLRLLQRLGSNLHLYNSMSRYWKLIVSVLLAVMCGLNIMWTLSFIFGRPWIRGDAEPTNDGRILVNINDNSHNKLKNSGKRIIPLDIEYDMSIFNPWTLVVIIKF